MVDRIEKDLEDMNLFERIVASLVGANKLVIKKDENVISFDYMIRREIDGAFPQIEIRTRLEYKWTYEEYKDVSEQLVGIGYQCPLCNNTFIVNLFRETTITNRDGEIEVRETFENCDNEPILIDAPVVCHECLEKDLGTICWDYDNNEMMVWTEEELAKLQQEVE